MGNSKYKAINGVDHLIKLKNEKLACTYFKDQQIQYVIEIFTVDFKTELIIKIFDYIEKILQLKNGKLAVYVIPDQHTLKIISFNDKSYNIEQIFKYDYPIDFLEAKKNIVVNIGSIGLQLLKEENNKYVSFSTISMSLFNLKNTINLNNDEIIYVYYNAIFFVDIKQLKISHKINISNKDQFIKVSIIRLNKKYVLISFTSSKGTRYFTIDFIIHQIVSITKSDIRILSLVKLSNGYIVRNKWIHRKEYSLIFYKYDKYRLKKIKELPLNIELVHFVEYDKNNLIAYIQEFNIWSSSSYIGFVNINNNGIN